MAPTLVMLLACGVAAVGLGCGNDGGDAGVLGLPIGSAAVAPTRGGGAGAAGGCAGACAKVLGCLGVVDAGEQRACVASCDAGGGRNLAEVAGLGCAEIVAAFAGATPGQGGGAAPTGGGGCAADCTGCAGDNDSCYAVAGGSHGIPCDPCCCTAAGGAPVWRTE